MAGPQTVTRYALVSAGYFVGAFLLVALLLWNVDRLVALGLVGYLYFLILVLTALGASALLFGGLRSFGHFRGHVLGGVLELGGAAVGFFGIIILGFWLQPAANFSLTVFVHGPGGAQDIPLRRAGYVRLDTGGQRRKAEINEDGEAYFSEIPASFRGKEAYVGLEADGYELANSDQKVRLNPGGAYVEVVRKQGAIPGYVHSGAGDAMAGVTINAAGITQVTNSLGYFKVVIPGDQMDTQVRLQATAEGYETWSGMVTPNSNDVTITMMRSKRNH